MVSCKVIIFIVQHLVFSYEWRGNVYFKPPNEFLVLLGFFFFLLVTGTKILIFSQVSDHNNWSLSKSFVFGLLIFLKPITKKSFKIFPRYVGDVSLVCVYGMQVLDLVCCFFCSLACASGFSLSHMLSIMVRIPVFSHSSSVNVLFQMLHL